MKIFLGLLLILLPITACAQEHGIPTQTLHELSKDLAQMQQAVVAAQSGMQAGNSHPLPALTGAPSSAASAPTDMQSALASPVAGAQGSAASASTGLSSSAASASMGVSSSEELFDELTAMASKMRDKYRNNPYISITGFTVEIGIPPSVSIEVEFKK